jgi:hypothetical protein
VGGLALVSLGGCAWIERAERPAWRAQAENACFARGLVKESAYIQPLSEISGPGICGMTRPLKITALDDGAVSLNKALTIDCPMVAALGEWLNGVVQPIAMARFGQRVAQVEAFGAYSCRSVDNRTGGPLSEHAFGNAIDVSGFKLADGREIIVERDWKRSDTQESAFLREAHAGACEHFTTVLGPGADVFHYNHLHLDLARHGATGTGARRYCNPAPLPHLVSPPAPSDGLPPAPEIEEPMDVARGRLRARSIRRRYPRSCRANRSRAWTRPRPRRFRSRATIERALKSLGKNLLRNPTPLVLDNPRAILDLPIRVNRSEDTCSGTASPK